VTNNASTVSKQTYDITLTGTGTGADALTTNQSANVVLGQADFDDQVTTASASVMTNIVWGAAISPGGKLAIASYTDNYIYVWNSVPTANGQAADYRLPVTTPTGVAWSGEDLLVAELSRHRVVRYAAPVSASSSPANVIGQPNLTTYSSGTTAAKLWSPYGLLVTSGGKLIVADWGNERGLIWNSVPTTNGVSANIVIGQSSFTTRTSGSASNKLSGPSDLAETPAGELLIAESGNNRVSVFSSVPTVNNANATLVLLQSGFGVASLGVSAASCWRAAGVAVSDTGVIAISDYSNNRIGLFYELPTTSGEDMDAVLGQANFTSGNAWVGGSANAQNMRLPIGLVWNGNDLIVTGEMKRAMIFKPA